MLGIVLRPLRAAALTLVAGLLLASVAPVVCGWRATVVLSGSMTPAVRPGDVVVASPVHPADANRVADSGRIRPDEVLGQARLRIPMIGLPVLWVRERRAVPLLCMSAVLALLLMPRGRRRLSPTRRSARRPARPGATGCTPGWSRSRR